MSGFKTMSENFVQLPSSKSSDINVAKMIEEKTVDLISEPDIDVPDIDETTTVYYNRKSEVKQ